jgi:hypothetical protein
MSRGGEDQQAQVLAALARMHQLRLGLQRVQQDLLGVHKDKAWRPNSQEQLESLRARISKLRTQQASLNQLKGATANQG